MAAGDSFQDLLGTIGSAKAAHKEATALRKTTGPRIPLIEHQFNAKQHWNPPPTKEAVKEALGGDACRHFNRYLKNNGSEYSEPGYLKAGSLDAWTAARAVQPTRVYQYPPQSEPRGKFRYRAHSEPIPQVSDEMCHHLHREWLNGHENRRQKHLSPVFHALLNVDSAQRLLDTREEQRRIARDLMTKAPDPAEMPKVPVKLKSALAKVRLGVKASKAFQSAGNINLLAAEEERDRALVRRAKSNPILALTEKDPPNRAQHLRRWGGTASSGRNLRESTPWQDQDEERTLKARQRERNQ